jgi:L-threonylcarbamoyladenylate synthase
VENVPDLAWDLIEFAEKPLTVVYEKGKNLPENVKATDGSIAIRLVKDEACQQLLYKFGRAIASTSANIAGEKTPQKYNEIDEKIIEKVDYTLMNIGPDEALPPSTIVKLGANGDFSFIRK